MLKALTVAILCGRCSLALSTLAGTVQSGPGVPVDGAKLTARHVPTGRSYQTTSQRGRYSFAGLPSGEFILDIAKDGMARAFAAVRLADNDNHEIGFVLVRKPSSVSRAAVEAAHLQREPLKGPRRPLGSGSVEIAKVLHKVAPVYPDSAKRAGVSGTVRIEGVVLLDGTINDLVVLSAPDPDLAVAGLTAAQQRRCSPVRRNGRPAETVTTIDFVFQLPPREVRRSLKRHRPAECGGVADGMMATS
jgi:TonB family protein